MYFSESVLAIAEEFVQLKVGEDLKKHAFLKAFEDGRNRGMGR